MKKNFYSELNDIIKKSEYVIFGAGINKEDHIKRYGKTARDPYALSLSFIFERLIYFLDKTDKNGEIQIIAESRGKKEDETLISYARSIVDRGTYHVTRDRMISKIKKFNFVK